MSGGASVIVAIYAKRGGFGVVSIIRIESNLHKFFKWNRPSFMYLVNYLIICAAFIIDKHRTLAVSRIKQKASTNADAFFRI